MNRVFSTMKGQQAPADRAQSAPDAQGGAAVRMSHETTFQAIQPIIAALAIEMTAAPGVATRRRHHRRRLRPALDPPAGTLQSVMSEAPCLRGEGIGSSD